MGRISDCELDKPRWVLHFETYSVFVRKSFLTLRRLFDWLFNHRSFLYFVENFILMKFLYYKRTHPHPHPHPRTGLTIPMKMPSVETGILSAMLFGPNRSSEWPLRPGARGATPLSAQCQLLEGYTEQHFPNSCLQLCHTLCQACATCSCWGWFPMKHGVS